MTNKLLEESVFLHEWRKTFNPAKAKAEEEKKTSESRKVLEKPANTDRDFHSHFSL